MGKKHRKLSEQEKLIFDFSKKSISAWTTFLPNQWGKSGCEPADLIIKIGRALLFINMQESKSYFNDLCQHNIKQAKDRMAQWQNGLSIKGKNDHTSFDISWDDVSSIAVISVIDGPYAACTYHSTEEWGLPDKVKLCASITSKVFGNLVARNASARDLIWICRALIGKNIVSEEIARKMVCDRFEELKNSAMSNIKWQPSRLGKRLINGIPVDCFEEFQYMLTLMKGQPYSHAVLFSDLSWAEILPASAFITSSIAQIEYLQEGYIVFKIFKNTVCFAVIVSSNMNGLAINISTFDKIATEAGAQFIFVVNLLDFGPLCNFIIDHNPCLNATEIELNM